MYTYHFFISFIPFHVIYEDEIQHVKERVMFLLTYASLTRKYIFVLLKKFMLPFTTLTNLFVLSFYFILHTTTTATAAHSYESHRGRYKS